MIACRNVERVYVSSTSFRDRSLAQVLAAADEAGVSGIELSALDDWDPALLEGSAQRRYLVHNYCPPPPTPFVLNLAASKEEALARSLAHCRSAIDLSAALGAPVYAAHAGFAADLEPGMLGDPVAQAAASRGKTARHEDTHATLVSSARALTEYAKARGVRFLIENHCLSKLGGRAGRRLLPMVTSDELLRLVRDVGDDSFGILVDVGHLNVSAHALGFDRLEALDSLAPFTGGFHVSDNDGSVDGHRSFGRDAWFLPSLRNCPTVPVTIELNRVTNDEIRRTYETVASY